MIVIPFLYMPSCIGFVGSSFSKEVSDLIQEKENKACVYPNSRELIKNFSNPCRERILKEVLVDRERLSYGMHQSTLHLDLLPKILARGKPLLNSVALFEETDFWVRNAVIRNTYVKTLLSTIHESSLVLEAFNKGSIHGSIVKNSPTFIQDMREALERMTWQYFSTLSYFLVGCVEDYYGLMHNEKIGKWLYNFVCQKSIISFCVISLKGIFLLKDKAGRFYILKFVLSDSDKHWVEKYSDSIPEEDRKDILSKKKTFLCFQNGQYVAPQKNHQNFLADLVWEEDIGYALISIDQLGQGNFF